jgi:outer membrane biosynthesis protein TonB
MTRTTITASLLLAAALALTTQAFAQAPSEAQRAAIKSNCRNDYIAHCSSIPPGGAASLECLQKNMSSLSASCASAVRAVEAPAAAPKAAEEPKAEPKTEPKSEPKGETKTETKTEPAPAAKEAKPEQKAASTARKPSQAQISAIKSNCRSDYPKVCAGVPTGGQAALECLEKNKAKVSSACAKAVAATGGGGGGAPTAAAGAGSSGGAPAAAAAPAAAGPAVIVLRPMRPREELFVLRSACGGDVRSLCAGVPVGGGRIIQCLASQAAALSPACKDVLGQFAQ